MIISLFKQRPAIRMEEITIPTDTVLLEGELEVPANAKGIVILAHGSGSSRHSPRNQYVARVIRGSGMGTILFDMVTRREKLDDQAVHRLSFDIQMLAERVKAATGWVDHDRRVRDLNIGYFGSSTGAAAALVAAAGLGRKIGAVVSRGGRPDLAGDALLDVVSPTLLVVGGLDHLMFEVNKDAYSQLDCPKALRVVPGARHLFEEPGKLEEMARLTADWFLAHLRSQDDEEAGPCIVTRPT